MQLRPEDLVDTAIRAARSGAEILRHYFAHRDQLQIQYKGTDRDLVSRADLESEQAIVEEILRSHPGHSILAEEGGVLAGTDQPHSQQSSTGPKEALAKSTGGPHYQWNDAPHYQWIIDPLDGTTNFLQGLPMFCVSIACREYTPDPASTSEDDRDFSTAASQLVAGVVLEPIGGHLFSAGKGLGGHWNERPLRVSTCSQLRDAYLATGFPLRSPAVTDLYLDMFRQVFGRTRSLRRCGAAALDLAYTAAGVYDGFFELGLAPWDIAAGTLLVQEAGGRVSDLDGGQTHLATGNVVAAAPDLHSELRSLVGTRASEAQIRQTLAVANGRR